MKYQNSDEEASDHMCTRIETHPKSRKTAENLNANTKNTHMYTQIPLAVAHANKNNLERARSSPHYSG